MLPGSCWYASSPSAFPRSGSSTHSWELGCCLLGSWGGGQPRAVAQYRDCLANLRATYLCAPFLCPRRRRHHLSHTQSRLFEKNIPAQVRCSPLLLPGRPVLKSNFGALHLLCVFAVDAAPVMRHLFQAALRGEMNPKVRISWPSRTLWLNLVLLLLRLCCLWQCGYEDSCGWVFFACVVWAESCCLLLCGCVPSPLRENVCASAARLCALHTRSLRH